MRPWQAASQGGAAGKTRNPIAAAKAQPSAAAAARRYSRGESSQSRKSAPSSAATCQECTWSSACSKAPGVPS